MIRTAVVRPRSSSASPCSSMATRPDVMAAFPAYPLATRAGWGFMVLTNMLPSQGNGTVPVHDARAGPRGELVRVGYADDDLRERERDACRSARSTRRSQGGTASGAQLCQLRLGVDAAAEDDPDRRLDDSGAGRRRRRRLRRTTTTPGRTSRRCFPASTTRTARSASGSSIRRCWTTACTRSRGP